MIELIVAYDTNRCIGKNGEIPWNIPEDMKHVKTLSLGKTVIMGRKTWESLPAKFRPLPGRTNVIITSQVLDVPAGVHVYTSIDEALSAHKNDSIVGFGGERIFAALLPLADRLYTTEVNQTVEHGDAFFPSIDENIWHVVSTEVHEGYTFKTWERI